MNTPIIHQLPPEISNLIAAGEVVERPASVVKELIENALDAKAQTINIEVQEGGLALIRVSDDGHGLGRLDAPRSVQAFATSKIRTKYDLDHIQTFGFRGEALSSMAAVAHLGLLTRAADEVEGTQVFARQSEVQVTPAASPVGTSVTIRNLFAWTPARRKFLKPPLRELTLIQQMVIKYALAHPQVAFRLVADGMPRLVLPPGSILERIGAVLGRDTASEMIPVDWQALDLKIQGYVSKPTLGRSRRDQSYFFVNGRPIRAGLLAVMVERPYTGLLPPSRYPVAIVRIDLAPDFIDINVHPQKSEIRFSRERSIYTALSQAVTQALSEFPKQAFGPDATIEWPFSDVASLDKEFINSTGLASALQEEKVAYHLNPLRPLAQIYDTYILAQSTGAAQSHVFLIDQHAAHEQILYEMISQSAIEKQDIVPVQVQLTALESELLQANQSLFGSLGIEIESFGGHHFVIRRLPIPLIPHLHNQLLQANQAAEAALLDRLLDELSHHKTLDPEDLREKLAQKAACVCAIKAGDLLSLEAMRDLLDDLLRIWSPAACPHGRPVFVGLSLEEIERRFGRR